MAGDVGGESAGGRLSRDPPRRPVSRGAWRQHGHGDTGRTRGHGAEVGGCRGCIVRRVGFYACNISTSARAQAGCVSTSNTDIRLYHKAGGEFIEIGQNFM